MTFKQIENHKAVESIHKEYDNGSNYSYWVYLKNGYINPEMECGLIHEPTLKLVSEQLKQVKLT